MLLPSWASWAILIQLMPIVLGNEVSRKCEIHRLRWSFWSRDIFVGVSDRKRFWYWSNKKCLSRPYHLKFFKGCIPQILLGRFLNTLPHIITIKSSNSWYDAVFSTNGIHSVGN